MKSVDGTGYEDTGKLAKFSNLLEKHLTNKKDYASIRFSLAKSESFTRLYLLDKQPATF